MAVIGIMDSGVGGLSVFREIRHLMPGHHYIYYSDNANCPYGDKSPEFIRERLHQITRFFLDKGVGAMVLACNTATAAGIEELRATYSIPFVGMEPAVKPAALGTKSGVIGVLATAGTLKGSKYLNTKGRFADQIRIEERVGRGFVELVESGTLAGPEAESVVEASLKPLLETGADRIVLGCTHYPFLLDSLRKVASRLGYPEVQFIDPAPAVAARLQDVLADLGAAAQASSSSDDSSAGATEYFASGDPSALLSFASRI